MSRAAVRFVQKLLGCSAVIVRLPKLLEAGVNGQYAEKWVWIYVMIAIDVIEAII
jgi:hypothetical protein